MPDPDVKINVEITKSGAGAQQAKAEIDQLKGSTDQADSSTTGLRSGISGLAMMFRGLTSVVAGAQNGIRGMGYAIGGFFQLVVAHPIGRLVAALVMLAGTLYTVISSLRTTKDELKEAKDQADIAAKAFDKIAQTKLDALKKSIDDLNNSLAQTLSQSDAALESLKSMRDAELAIETAKVNKDVAYGKITPEEGERRKLILKRETDTAQRETEAKTLTKQQAEIEATDRENRLKVDWVRKEKEKYEGAYGAISNSALSAGAVTPQELLSDEGMAKAKNRAEEAAASAEMARWLHTGLGTKPVTISKYQENVEKTQHNLFLIQQVERLNSLKEQANKQYDTIVPKLEKDIAVNDALYRKKQSRLNVLPLEQKATDEEFKGALQTANTKEDQRKKSEELKLKRESLEREYQKAEEAKNVAKAGQLSKEIAATKVQEYETSITGTRVEPAMQAAEKKNINEQQAAVFEKFSNEQDKKSLEKRADLALDQQRAEEQAARIQLQAAEKVVGDKKLSPRQRAQAKQDLSLAQSRWGKERSDVDVAEATIGKIRETSSTAELHKLVAALERMAAADSERSALYNQATNTIDQHTQQIKQQSSQLKNGGLRTK